VALPEKIHPVLKTRIGHKFCISLIDHRKNVVRKPLKKGQNFLSRYQMAGRVVRVTQKDELGPRSDPGQEVVDTDPIVLKRTFYGRGAHHPCRLPIDRKRGIGVETLVAGVEKELTQE
jgi:hypothetical protein